MPTLVQSEDSILVSGGLEPGILNHRSGAIIHLQLPDKYGKYLIVNYLKYYFVDGMVWYGMIKYLIIRYDTDLGEYSQRQNSQAIAP